MAEPGQGLHPVTVPQLARRFGWSNRRACAFMRQMRHGGRTARDMYTTEEWLAAYLAAESLPAQNWPPPNYDPLELIVLERALALVEGLVRAGRVQVVAA